MALRSTLSSSTLSRFPYINQVLKNSRPIAMNIRNLCTVSSGSVIGVKPLPFSAIPGPKGTIFNMLDFARNGGLPNIDEILKKRFDRYGPIYREKIFDRVIVSISDADAIGTVFRIDETFPMRPGFDVYDKIRREQGSSKDPQLASGLMSNDYEEWSKPRSLLATPMLRPKEVNKAFPRLNNVARDFADRMAHLSQTDDENTNIEEELAYWAAESMGIFIFNQRLGFYKQPPDPKLVAFISRVHEVLKNIAKLAIGGQMFDFRKMSVYNEMRNLLSDNDKTIRDIVDRAMSMQPHGEVSLFDRISEGENLPREDIWKWFRTLLGAGVDTTSTAALWVIYQLSTHPQSQQKAFQELKFVLGTEHEISSRTIGHLPFLKACVKESFRLTSPTFLISRAFNHDIEVLGFSIPAGVSINCYPYIESTAEKRYGVNAKEFVPERWLRDETGRNDHHSFALLPFGYGTRMCLGRRVAEAEIYALVSQLLMRFRLEYAGRRELKPLMAGAMFKPDKPLVVKFIPR